MSSYSDSIAMRYPAPRQRSLSSLRTPSLLPDISEHSPSRTPSPPPQQVLRRPTHFRSLSVTSFLSDGTIEIEGFGFDNLSEIGDDASIYGGESVYADSVFDGHDDDDDNDSVIVRPHTPSDLSWRAERILANAKKKLDLCGQNISRARSSLILSPSTTPTSFHEQLDSVKAMPALHSHRFRFRNDGMPGGGGGNNSFYGTNSHMRTNSESAVPYARKGVNGSRSSSRDGLGTIEDVDEQSAEIGRPQSEQSISPSKSTQQMRTLRDQMKDLRGKITSLQNQAKSDSMKRRSVTSLRSTPNPYDSQSTPSLDDLKVEDLSPIEPGETWENAEEIPDDYSSTRSGTPRAFRRSASPLEARHEDREDAFSYDALFYGDGAYASSSTETSRPMSYGSDGTGSTTTVLELPRITAVRAARRRDSFGSIDSFATAAEDSPSLVSNMQRPVIPPTPPLTVPGEWLSPTMSSPRDDGYHSAPHTPRSPYHKDSSSSLSSEATKINRPTPPFTSSFAPTPTACYPPAKSTTSTSSDEFDTSIDARITHSKLSRHPHRRSGISIGSTHIATTGNPSNNDSKDALLLTSADGLGDISLKLGRGDRELIEKMIEGLGAVCCSMEMEINEKRRGEWRKRLEGALAVLSGEVTVAGHEGRRRRRVGQQGLGIREDYVGESEDECF